MATKRKIVEDLKHSYGPSLTVTDVADYLGSNWAQAKRALAGVPYFTTGEKDKRRKYLAIDIAEMVRERMVGV